MRVSSLDVMQLTGNADEFLGPNRASQLFDWLMLAPFLPEAIGSETQAPLTKEASLIMTDKVPLAAQLI